ncbi:TonB-dependent receptor [Alteromonas lipotrueiana]|uniref:TonB-dependent receptor n=1 Tax=Alteromonas lipotrueiana TaxID=2803815 RepID=UPI001C440035|nr:TonB-dependent receptor [Alteromonas lipotrueiana]
MSRFGKWFLKIGLLSAVSFGVHAKQVFEFSIQAQSADEALTEFARQADTTLLFSYELAQQVKANPLTGKFTLQEGLQALLQGTELAVQVDARGMLTVRHVDEISKTTAPVVKTSDISDEPETFSLERIAIVGSRNTSRSVVSSAVPLDILTSDTFKAQAGADLLGMLASAVPSLNVNDQPINDATSLVRPANLRGMASDHTLLLLNGKRRHRSAVITFLGGGLSDGAQGPDISVLPASAMKQVEILRDGAAAQYGSDAIAGVINFVLKDADEGGTVAVKTGQYGAGDGELVQFQANVGLPLSTNGFLNLSAEYRQQNSTARSVQRDDAQALIDAGNHQVASPAQVWGSLAVDHDIKLAANAGYDINSNHRLYGFSNAARRKTGGGFFYRHPHFRSGVFSQPQGDELVLLVADLDGLNTGIQCPDIQITEPNVLNQSDYQQIADNSTALGANCFAFNEWFEGGFTPQFGGIIEDASLFGGIEGQLFSQWQYDISFGAGYSNIAYELIDTVNPSLGPESPLRFSPGAVSQIERTFNFDLAGPAIIGLPEPVYLGVGAEWRRETYHQREGDELSWQTGPYAFDQATQTAQGFSIGSNGFPGYQPQTAGHWSRQNWALYADAESQLHTNLEAGLAVRLEHYSDFGSTFNGKFSSRWQMTESYALRGSLSSGFKAPTVGQSNVINVTTAYSAQGLQDQATLPPTHPISQQLGANALSPERSVNVSLGAVAMWSEQFYLTLDYFNIKLKNRISTTSAIALTPSDITALERQGIEGADEYGAAKFFTNDFDTHTQGLDLVLNYNFATGAVTNELTAAYNWTHTEVDSVTLYPTQTETDDIIYAPNLTSARINMLESNLPAHRATVTLKQYWQAFSVFWRGGYFGSYYEDHLDAAAGFDINGKPMFTLDVELGWLVTEQLTLAIGAKNVFNTYPQLNPYRGEVGAKYPATAPGGINGGFYYAEARFTF